MYSNVTFKCVDCGTALVGNIIVPDIAIDNDEEASDTQVVECGVCRRNYHLDIVNRAGLIDVSIAGIESTGITVSNPEMYQEIIEPAQDWRSDYDWYVNLNQKTVFEYFTVSIMNIRNMFTLRIDDRNQLEMLNRMLLVQCISCLEAYLSDTLISRITADSWLLGKLFEIDPILKNEKFLVSEFIADNKLPLKKAKSYLDGLMYHNLPKIEALYRYVLDVKFDYDTDENKGTLLSAIESRHDFVHRNGKTKSTGDLRIIDKKYISDILLIIELLVGRIEARLKEIDEEIPF
jgi:hypothetical protein